MENQQKPVHEQVLETIEKGQVQMRPRWHFVLRAVAAGLGGALLFLFLLYLVSFLFFAWHDAAFWMAPPFAWARWCAFLVGFPRLPLLFVVLLLIAFDWLVRRNTSAYRRPFAVSLIVIGALAALFGLAIARSPFHPRMSRYVIDRRIPFAEPMYRAYGPEHFRALPADCDDARRLPPPGFYPDAR